MAEATDATHQHDIAEESGYEHAHPGVWEYVKVAAVLAVLTAIEVVLYYVEGTLGEGPTVAGLITLMVLKFVLVALWFMHLKFDSPIFRRLFIAGIVLAIAIYAVILITLSPTISLPLR